MLIQSNVQLAIDETVFKFLIHTVDSMSSCTHTIMCNVASDGVAFASVCHSKCSYIAMFLLQLPTLAFACIIIPVPKNLTFQFCPQPNYLKFDKIYGKKIPISILPNRYHQIHHGTIFIVCIFHVINVDSILRKLVQTLINLTKDKPIITYFYGTEIIVFQYIESDGYMDQFSIYWTQGSLVGLPRMTLFFWDRLRS